MSCQPTKLKTYGFAICIIAGIGGLAVGGVGVAGYLGGISNLNQVHAIIMMAAGGGSGTLLFIIGVVGAVKNRRNHILQSQLRDSLEIIESTNVMADGSLVVVVPQNHSF